MRAPLSVLFNLILWQVLHSFATYLYTGIPVKTLLTLGGEQAHLTIKTDANRSFHLVYISRRQIATLGNHLQGHR
jgi:hypothetical protein